MVSLRFILCFLLVSSAYATIVSHDGRAITIDGHRRVLLSGSIHYPRSTPEMWPDLIKKGKEGGLDAIETYVFWNAHEPTRRQYDFSGKLDIIRFLKTIQDEGLYGVLRIGPYACAEWNYGGFPMWLHNMPGMVFRTTNKAFMIENEYGNVMGSDGESGKEYIKWYANMAQSLDVGVPWIMYQQNDAPQPMLNTCNGFYCDNFVPNNPNTPKMEMMRSEELQVMLNERGDNERFSKNQRAMLNERGWNVRCWMRREREMLGGQRSEKSEQGSSCFFGNGNETSDATISFQRESYVVPAWSVTILPDCKNKAYNTAKITTQTSRMVKKPNEAEDSRSTLKWSWRPENMDNFLLKGKGKSTYRQLFDQKVVSNDQSDYLWYMTTIKFKKRDPFLGNSMSLRVNSTAHVLHAFVNGKHIGNQHAENGNFHYVFEKDVKFKSGHNVISLLSITVGLANYGAFFESKPAGITGPISIIGRNGDETIVKDLSAHKCSYKTGLNGFEHQLFRTESMSKWSVESVPFNRTMTWYKATFKGPLGNNPVVVDLLGLGKGAYHAGKCLTNCGEPTQRWYHVPRSFLNAERDNTLVLFEEMGGNPTLVSFQTTRVRSVCANVYDKNIIELSCDRKPISAINFASFGNPDGNCGTFERGTCE
ncbi:hypothetical protein N665_0070s0004 [Sinapis alba]|nr:hypothetical protein N665_0070s0004 [Sinapis alba]